MFFVQFVHLIDKEVLSSQKTRTPVKTIKSSFSLSSLTTPPTLVQCPPLFHLSISSPYPPLLPSLTNFITKLFPLTSHPPKSPRPSYHTLMSFISFHPLPLPCYPSQTPLSLVPLFHPLISHSSSRQSPCSFIPFIPLSRQLSLVSSPSNPLFESTF